MPSASANGVDIAYEAFGNPGDPCVLLIMGFNMPLTAWPVPFCRKLAAAGYHVIRFDNRDVGLSSRLDHLGQPNVAAVALQRLIGMLPRTPYTLADMADDSVGLLDALGLDRAHVVGISMGGMIAQLMALRAPERLLSLGLMMTSSGARRFLFPSPRLLPVLLRQPEPDPASQLRYALRFWRAVAGRRYPPDEQAVVDEFQAAAGRSTEPHGRMRQLAAMLAAPDRRRALGALELPTTVIHGGADPLIFPSAGAALARAIGGARFELIPGLGHYLPPVLFSTLSAALIRNFARA